MCSIESCLVFGLATLQFKLSPHLHYIQMSKLSPHLHYIQMSKLSPHLHYIQMSVNLRVGIKFSFQAVAVIDTMVINNVDA